MKYTNEKQKVAGSRIVFDLPTHAYHPNASLRMLKRTAYVAWPTRNDRSE